MELPNPLHHDGATMAYDNVGMDRTSDTREPTTEVGVKRMTLLQGCKYKRRVRFPPFLILPLMAIFTCAKSGMLLCKTEARIQWREGLKSQYIDGDSTSFSSVDKVADLYKWYQSEFATKILRTSTGYNEVNPTGLDAVAQDRDCTNPSQYKTDWRCPLPATLRAELELYGRDSGLSSAELEKKLAEIPPSNPCNAMEAGVCLSSPWGDLALNNGLANWNKVYNSTELQKGLLQQMIVPCKVVSAPGEFDKVAADSSCIMLSPACNVMLRLQNKSDTYNPMLEGKTVSMTDPIGPSCRIKLFELLQQHDWIDSGTTRASASIVATNPKVDGQFSVAPVSFTAEFNVHGLMTTSTTIQPLPGIFVEGQILLNNEQWLIGSAFLAYIAWVVLNRCHDIWAYCRGCLGQLLISELKWTFVSPSLHAMHEVHLHLLGLPRSAFLCTGY